MAPASFHLKNVAKDVVKVIDSTHNFLCCSAFLEMLILVHLMIKSLSSGPCMLWRFCAEPCRRGARDGDVSFRRRRSSRLARHVRLKTMIAADLSSAGLERADFSPLVLPVGLK
jgi:hypothetical protein